MVYISDTPVRDYFRSATRLIVPHLQSMWPRGSAPRLQKRVLISTMRSRSLDGLYVRYGLDATLFMDELILSSSGSRQ